MVIFSEQDVIKDPPFSKLDLISCRNLLIYMGAELQKKLMPLFHYALNPGGMLFLGTSETVGEFVDLFAPMDRKSKDLYQRKEDDSGAHRLGIPGLFERPPGNDIARPPGRARSAKASFRCARLPNARSCNTTPRLARWSTNAATSFTSTAAPAGTWNRPRARLA